MKKLKALFFIFILPFALFGWSPGGHMTGGAIAYQYLKEHNPAVLDKVLHTLRMHPWMETKWSDKMQGLSEEQKAQALFMLASTYPDDARSFPELGGGEMKKWHYVDYPFVPDEEEVFGEDPDPINAQEKLISFITSLKTQTESAQKAVDVCWTFHLLEDIHQPLHTVSMFDGDLPHGDRGGNSRYIKLPTGGAAKKLHSYWDGLITGTLRNIPAKATALLAKPQYQEANLSELTTNTDVESWIKKESFPLAVSAVYKNGSVNGVKGAPTTVSNSYVTTAKKTAERRVVLSGIRLAKKLIEIYE